MITRRGALSMLSAAPLVVKTDLLSNDDLAVLKLAAHLDDKEGKSWENGSEMSETIQSLARRGYLEQHADIPADHKRPATKWYRPTEKGRLALENA